jgi:16S rRNA (cytosine967-C5)-methyltransferase
MSDSPRQIALNVLRRVGGGAYTDVALHEALSGCKLADRDRQLVVELTCGIVRRQRTLDAIVDRLARKQAAAQPPDLRTLLRLGLYQMVYLDRVPTSAAVNTTVELAKVNGLGKLSGVINGILRAYSRHEGSLQDFLELDRDGDNIKRIGTFYSFPDWLISHWLEVLGEAQTEKLCEFFNLSPQLHLRVNSLKIDRPTVLDAFDRAGIAAAEIAATPMGILVVERVGTIDQLPGYREGWWTVQDASAQLVTQLLAPQPGETIVDACAAPGGKTTHIAELMGDRGRILACDRTASRLSKLHDSVARLGLQSIEVKTGDSRSWREFDASCDRVLLDVPCSGLGTLHRRADARWQKQPATIAELATLQAELLQNAAAWVKPGGTIVYATCTIHPEENEGIIAPFLAANPDWHIDPPQDPYLTEFADDRGTIHIWPHRHHMDGFFCVRLKNSKNSISTV